MSGSQRGDNYSDNIRGIVYESTKGYVFGTESKAVSYSLDGSLGNWSIKSGLLDNVRNVVYRNGKFVKIGDSGYISYSSDGKTWYSAQNSSGNSLIIGNNCLCDIIYTDKFVVVGDYGYTAYSSDGETWYLGDKASSSLINAVNRI